MEGCSRRFVFLTLLLVLVLSSLCGAVNIYKRSVNEPGSQCPTILSCLTPAQMILDWIDNDDIKTLHTLAYPAFFDNVCGQKQAIINCLQPLSCTSYKITYKGLAVKKVLDQLCNETRNDFQTEVKCFARDDAYHAVELCSAMLLLRFDMYEIQMEDDTHQVADFCSHFDKFLHCVHSGIERECNNRAAGVISTLYRATIEPMTTTVGCALGPAP